MSRLGLHTFIWCLIIFLNLTKTIEGASIPSSSSTTLSDNNKSNKNNNNNNEQQMEEYLPNTGIKFDEYPMIVPKRAAMLLDRIMVALHHALEDDEKGSKKITDIYKDGRFYNGKIDTNKMQRNFMKFNQNGRDFDDELTENQTDLETREITDQYNRQSDESMGLQRRGHGTDTNSNKGRVYWRCYFNAVTCF